MRRIVGGIWKPGSLLPGEVDIAGELGCARATVNRAMRELAADGIIERKRKAGTRVLASPRRHVRFDIPLVREEIEASGARYRYALILREVTDAPDWLSTRLGLASGGRALHLVCMHYGDGLPYQHEDRWISLATLPQAEHEDFSKRGPNEWLVATIPYSDAELSFSATGADAGLAEHFDCPQGTPLFRTDRTTWWQGDAVTRVRLVFRPGHRVTTRY